MSDFLEEMVRLSEQRAAAISRGSGLRAEQLEVPVPPLKLSGFAVIAEIKQRSPSEGVLDQQARSLEESVEAYAKGGAAAISVLTEPSRFAGELSHLTEAAAIAGKFDVPVMRKDFLTKPIQVLEARAAGAGGLLLISAILSDTQLGTMLDCAYEYSMFVLLECFDEQDLKRCRRLMKKSRHIEAAVRDQFLIGINSRNLRTLAVDAYRLAALAPLLPDGVKAVAESGIQDLADIEHVLDLGYEVALVGTALMRSVDPAGLIREFIETAKKR